MHPYLPQRLAIAICIALLSVICLSETEAKESPVKYSPSLYSGLKWRSIGPFRGGRCLTVSGVRGKPTLYYMGGCGAGVWRTDDAGSTWFPISDTTFHSSSVGALAVAPSDPNIIYVGMGEAAIRNTVAMGDGMYKSTDAGKTWKHIGLDKSYSIARIAVHPWKPEIAYVAVLGQVFGKNKERGVYRTTDGGSSWQQVLSKDDSTGAIDIKIDPTNPNNLYASMWHAERTAWSMTSGGETSGLYKSTDGGTTWELLSHNPGMPKGLLGKICVSVSPVNSDRIYAMIENEHGGLFRSDDGGKKWQQLDTNNNLTQRPWYFSSVFADPKQIDVVYVMNVEFWKSTNGGSSFTKVGQEHGDNHDMWINPDNSDNYIIGDDGSAAITFNGAKTWSKEALPTSQFYHVNLDNDFPYNVYGAQQDWGSMRIASRTTGGEIGIHDWYGVAGGEAGYIVPNPLNPDITYGGEYDGMMSKYTKSTDQYQFINPYPESCLGDGACTRKYRFQWTYPIMISPFDSKIIYATSQVVHKTTNEGQTWEIISPDLTRNEAEMQCSSGGPITKDNTGAETYPDIFAFAPSPLKQGLLWAGTDDGLVHISSDEGKHWQNVTPTGLPQWAIISILEPSHYEAGSCYLAAHRYKWDDRHPYIFKTSDYGKSWKQITEGIGSESYTHCVREDPHQRGLLYAGTEKGVYVSFNDGENWQSLQLNLPVTPVRDIQVQARDNDLVIATHGRSFWILDDITPLYQLNDQMASADQILFKPRATARMDGGGADTAITAGQNAPGGAIIRYNFKKKPEGEIKLIFLNEKRDTITWYSSVRDRKKEPVKIKKEFYEDPSAKRPGVLRADSGANTFVWDLRHDDAEEFEKDAVMQGSLAGPKVIPGKYFVQLRRNDTLLAEQPFDIYENPKIKVSASDLAEQNALALQIRDTISAIHRAVKRIRKIRASVESFMGGFTDSLEAKPFKEAAKTLLDSLDYVENQFIQPKIKAGEDALRFPIKLNDKLATLYDFVKSADAKPTDQDRLVFDDLTIQAGKCFATLKRLEEGVVPSFNNMADKSRKPVIDIQSKTK
ncbi:MAG: glycosyl hydrolase [Bacteroidota bacterium]|nr:glycosyl hydrolase [Bacteroidota bacterium]